MWRRGWMEGETLNYRDVARPVYKMLLTTALAGALQTPKSWKITTQFASDVNINKLTMCVGKPSSCGCHFLFNSMLKKD